VLLVGVGWQIVSSSAEATGTVASRKRWERTISGAFT
jgi:hypothetical protein